MIAAMTMSMDEENSYMQHILQAKNDVPEVVELSLYTEWKLIQALKAVFSPDFEHDPKIITRFMADWIKTDPGERTLFVENWLNENPTTQNADVTDESTDKANENIASSVQDRAFTHQQYSFEQRALGTWLYGLFDELSDDQKLEISRLNMDMDATYPQNVLLACRNNDIRQLQHVFPETLADLFNDTKSIWPADGKSPQLGQLVSFFSDWINGHNTDTASIDGRKSGRDAVTAKWLKKSGKQITQYTDIGTNAGGDVKTDRPEGAPHNLDTLDIELACALYPSDFDVFEVPGPIFRRAKEMVRQKEEPWKSWSAVLRKSAGILDVNRTAIFNLVRLAPEDIHLDPVKHLEFVNHTLTTEFAKATELLPLNTGNSASTPEDISKSLAAERGEFVPGFSNPADPKWVHEDLSQPKVENLGSGIFSFEGLTGSAPSNEVAKQEVENVDHVQMEETGNSQGETETPVPAVESVDATDPQAATLTSTEILAANAPHLADQVETDKNQNTDIPHQTEPEAEQKQPEAEQIEPLVQEPEPPVPQFPAYFEPGRYEGLPNEVYHAANGISSTQVKDARISLMYFNGRHVARTIPREETRALQFGTVLHALTLEPEKFGEEFMVFPGLPEDAISTTAEMKKIIEEFNAALPPLVDVDSLKKRIEAHNSSLPAPLSLNGNAEETALQYQGLAEEFRRIPETEKHTAAAMKACIKEFNATLPQALKVSGGRDALLEQLAAIEPEFIEAERAKKQPYNVSGNKDVLASIVREINPEAIFADEFTAQWQAGAAGKSIVSDVDFAHLEALNRAVYAHSSAGKLLRHPSREVEVSYFGIDEQTGLEVRVRPDIELEIDGMRIAADLKTLGIANVKQERLRDRLHREITERDYHLSAAMYSEVADFDQFFWIFINKEPGYNWVAVIEASPELLELGSLEYHNTMQAIATAFDTGVWPAPITSDYTDELNDFDLRRLEALRTQA
ncbi:PD-(D/E)XK nuclease-like domain-containing protein [Superficieibacter sp. 1612_C1]|uniref:PD-(D/E)XK nuclease-like domain-containing protein n=1 Tax=Superficieibacter sp. 1612_C1 TaxID=2780382 RepID=UPI00351B7F1D